MSHVPNPVLWMKDRIAVNGIDGATRGPRVEASESGPEMQTDMLVRSGPSGPTQVRFDPRERFHPSSVPW